MMLMCIDRATLEKAMRPVKQSLRTARQRGFTLIELMAVVLLIGFTLGIGLRLGLSGDPRELEIELRELAAGTELMAQQAVLDGRIYGLDFHTSAESPAGYGYRWLQRQQDQWTAFETRIDAVPVSNKIFESVRTLELLVTNQSTVPEPLTDLAVSETAESFMPEIVLLPTREITPFKLRLASDAGDSVTLSADLMGRLYLNEDVPTPPQ